ncbi:site-specific integrase [Saccharibacillus brassicae]|uniref:Site-specific integrase n=1 Tax=Saccharibacillus brassicae TaxID=2583377 RepID=A0A4Y6V0C8_SACBS|nr:site-specific integrase [Saccharibacillus brassicae]QDH23502.1 site-specific integrase [Saccharibacillus brassicae]
MASFKKHDAGWEFRIRYKDPFTQKFREKSQRGFETKKAAQIAAAELEKQLAAGYEQSDLPLADFLYIWLEEYKKGTVRKNTYELHKNNIKNHLVPYFKKISLRDVKPIMYQEFLNHFGPRGYSRRTIELIHATMHNALDKAVTLGKLEKNPCNGVEIRGEKNRGEVQFIESEDIPKFLEATWKYGYIYWIFFKSMIGTGMRKGEAAALKWPDIDWEQKKLRIDETLDFTAADKSELFGDPKTYRSKRFVHVPPALMEDLRKHQEWQQRNREAMGPLYHHDLDLVFCRTNGNFMPKSSLFNAFSRICHRADLPELPIHSLRHTYAVLMLEAGADIKFVQEQLGHGSVQITSDVYAHISKKLKDRNMKKFELFTDHLLK